jgi:hypothetical protein
MISFAQDMVAQTETRGATHFFLIPPHPFHQRHGVILAE